MLVADSPVGGKQVVVQADVMNVIGAEKALDDALVQIVCTATS
jgi:hypothetical protein